MSEKILYGDELALGIVSDVSDRIRDYRDMGRVARFATMLVGNNPASKRYIEMKQAEGKDLGIDMGDIELPADITQDELDSIVSELSERNDLHALLIQYPIPSGLNYLQAISRLDPHMDVDGLHPSNLGLLLHDPDPENYPGIIPCTPNGVVQLLKHGGVETSGANVVVVGRGMTIGAPLSVLIGTKKNGMNATVTTVHSGTVNLEEHLKTADIIVGAAGSPGLIKGHMVKQGVTLVSVGVSYNEEGKARGDFTSEARDKAGIVVPVTRGIGPMTRANLWRNVIRCYELQQES